MEKMVVLVVLTKMVRSIRMQVVIIGHNLQMLHHLLILVVEAESSGLLLQVGQSIKWSKVNNSHELKVSALRRLPYKMLKMSGVLLLMETFGI